MPQKAEIKFDKPTTSLLLVNKYLWLILVIVFLLTLLAGYFMVLQHKITNIQVAQEDTSMVIEEESNISILVQQIQDLEIAYNEIKQVRADDLAKLKRVVPTNPQIAELFVMAESLAISRGFQLVSIDISDDVNQQTVDAEGEVSEQSSSLNSLTVNITIARESEEDNPLAIDPYDTFKYYLDDLERNLRLMDIETVNFSGLDSDGANTSFDFSIITYYQNS